MDFMIKLFKAEKENQVFSPINIMHGFGLLLNGANGYTKKEICAILGFGKFSRLRLRNTVLCHGQTSKDPFG